VGCIAVQPIILYSYCRVGNDALTRAANLWLLFSTALSVVVLSPVLHWCRALQAFFSAAAMNCIAAMCCPQSTMTMQFGVRLA
jgi:hypothetical protein